MEKLLFLTSNKISFLQNPKSYFQGIEAIMINNGTTQQFHLKNYDVKSILIIFLLDNIRIDLIIFFILFILTKFLYKKLIFKSSHS